VCTVVISNHSFMSKLFHDWFAGLLLVICFYFLIYYGICETVSAVSFDVFQSTHCIVYSYCFSCFEFLLNFSIIIKYSCNFLEW